MAAMFWCESFQSMVTGRSEVRQNYRSTHKRCVQACRSSDARAAKPALIRVSVVGSMNPIQSGIPQCPATFDRSLELATDQPQSAGFSPVEVTSALPSYGYCQVTPCRTTSRFASPNGAWSHYRQGRLREYSGVQGSCTRVAKLVITDIASVLTLSPRCYRAQCRFLPFLRSSVLPTSVRIGEGERRNRTGMTVRPSRLTSGKSGASALL